MDISLSDDEKEYLLALARSSIASEWNPGTAEPTPPKTSSPSLDSYCGAFVTLHEGDRLRGCIGNMVGRRSLKATVRAMAKAAAFEDPRFQPLRQDELPRCRIEISVLSPMTSCPDPDTVIVGKHGVYIVRCGCSGVFLPQVPVEQGWNREEYLDCLCEKAGLPPESYLAPDAELYTFTAVVFSENE